jgi:hypothetical protein
MKTFLELHNECTTNRKLPKILGRRSFGLCESVLSISDNSLRDTLKLFEPTEENMTEYGVEPVYWASGDQYQRYHKYTDLRETIILFCAAINEEL